MGLVHELEQLVDDRLEEPPVSSQESRVLAHDVHDVRGDDGLVVLALLLLAKAKQVLEEKKKLDEIRASKGNPCLGGLMQKLLK